MIVDVNTRVWESPDQLGPSLAARLRRAAEGPWELPDASVGALTEAMEPVHYAFVMGAVSRLTGANVTTEQVSRCVRTDATRLLGFASVDPMGDGGAAEVDAAKSAGMAGITVSPTNQGFHPTHSRAMRVYRRCVEAGLPVVFDLSCVAGVSVMAYGQPYLLDEVLRELPGLRVLIAGLGQPFVDQTLVLVQKHEHAYADIAGLSLRARDLYQALASAYQGGAISKIMLGSGFPLTTPEKAIVTLYSLNTLIVGTNLPSIPREQLRSIVERDALACLGIAYPDGGVKPGQSAAARDESAKITQTWEVAQVKETTRP